MESTLTTPTAPADKSARLSRRLPSLQQLDDIRSAIGLRLKYRDATMIRPHAYVENILLAAEAARRTSGAIAECGTWRGGMAAGLMERCGPRQYFFFDSFEGLPDAKELDGLEAVEYQQNADAPGYYDNCTASEATFRSVIARAPQQGREVTIVKGWFEETLPVTAVPSLSVLRLDGDWYESTMTCLTNLWDLVLPGGLILIDDYHAWEGCSRAVHDFLSSRKAVERILTGRIARVAHIWKS